MSIASIHWGYVQVFFSIMAFAVFGGWSWWQYHKAIPFRGVRVEPGWPEKLKQAQIQTLYTVGGKPYRRIAYGEENEDWGAGTGLPCHDCAALKGELHVVGCDVERCPVCEAQAITCKCDYEGVKK